MSAPAPPQSPRRPPHSAHRHHHPSTGRGTPPPGRSPVKRRTPPPGPSLIRLADPRRRATVLLVGSMVVLTLFGGRLLELQAVRGEALAAAAVDQRLRTVTIPAARGSITDSSGAPLAETVEARNVTVDQTLVTDPAGEAAQMAPWLGMRESEVEERLTGTRRFVYVAKGITPEQWRGIEALRLPGVFSERTSERVYPAGDLAANVVGFVNAEGDGAGGLEFGLQDVLAGVDGTVTYERASGGKAIPTAGNSRVDPVPGTSVRLTIDRDIQYVAQRAIAAKVKATQADSGTVVVMDPRTGEILALATAPTFNPNKPGAAPEDDRGNRALGEVYEPGSTSKLITLAAVVDQGAAIETSAFTIPPVLRRAGEEFQDHTPHGTLHLTLAGIMAQSSNIGTILAAERIGEQKLFDYMKRFGIGEPTGIGFPGESDGYIPPPSKWSGTSFPTISFGQGLSVNAVQATSVFATVANDGVRVEPSLVSAYVSPSGEVTRPDPPATSRVISKPTAASLRRMLETVVSDEGTAPMAAIPGYRVGGKTGTAQYVDPSCGCYRGVVASFIGMAPADDPELVVGVTVVNPRAGRYGGQLGGPVFKDVMSYALQARAIPPTGTRPPQLPLSLDGDG